MSPPPRHSFVKRSKANNAARRQSRWTAMLHLTVRYASSKPMLATGEHQAALVEIPKQPGRARPSRCEAEDCCDARLSKNLGMPRSRSPASSYCTASARDRSDWDVWAFKAKLHLQSGTRCFGPEVCTAK